MTSILAFLWRRQSSSPEPNGNNEEHPHDGRGVPSPLPIVSNSSSGETFASSGKDDDDENMSFLSAKEAAEDEPLTPDGLRPRLSAEDLRKELHHLLPTVSTTPSTVLPPPPSWFASTTTTTTTSTTLPPMSSYHGIQVASSPRVSSSLFYSRTSTNMYVAASPILQVGQVRTAVGAVVAMREAQAMGNHEEPPQDLRSQKQLQKQHSSFWSGSSVQAYPPTVEEEADAVAPRLGVLPARQGWMSKRRNDDDGDSSTSSGTSSSSDSQRTYHILNGSRSNSQKLLRSHVTPIRLKRSSYFLPASGRSHHSFDSSLVPSPGFEYQQLDHHQADVSYPSHRGLADAIHTQERYDFDCIMDDEDIEPVHVSGREVVVSHYAENSVNVSAISNSTMKDSDCNESILSPEHETDAIVYYNDHTQDEEMATALRRRKAFNQRRAKEDLLVGLVERLQDNVQLVSEMDGRRPDGTAADHFLKTPLNSEGLLTGFSKETRLTLIRDLESIVNEMSVAQPEEFFLSPTQMQGIAETHDDLRHALTFCRNLVEMAIPESEKEEWGSFARLSGGPQLTSYRWKCLPSLRVALGIDKVPESPEPVRGGGSSLFSLPSDSADTPHTSNVSNTTTITSSRVTPVNARQTLQSQHEKYGTELRQTMEVSCTFVQRMSIACHQLLKFGGSSTQKLIRATEQVKGAYLHLISMRAQDLKDLIDSFELELPSMQLTRQVSDDDHDPCLRPPPALVRSTGVLSRIPDGAVRVDARLKHHNAKNDSGQFLFSPETNDMVTTEPEYEEEESEDTHGYDDLRRQVGSNDYDDNEIRDGPETCVDGIGEMDKNNAISTCMRE